MAPEFDGKFLCTTCQVYSVKIIRFWKMVSFTVCAEIEIERSLKFCVWPHEHWQLHSAGQFHLRSICIVREFHSFNPREKKSVDLRLFFSSTS